MQYFIPLIIPLLSLFLQTYPRLFNKYFGVDVWTRMLEIEHVRQAGHKIPGKINKGFIIGGLFDYPIAFPWLFSFIPKKTVFKIQGFVSPFFDVLQNVLVFTITYQLTSDITTALIAQIMYSVIPIIPIENSYLTPRSMGYLNFTLAFYPLMMYHINREPSYLFLGIFFSTTLFLVHRFALQSLLIICIVFTIVDQSLIYLTVFVVSFVLANIFTLGYYMRVLKGHLFNIYFWVINYRNRFAHQIYGNSPMRKQDWVGKIYFLLSKFPFIFLFVLNVWSFSSIIFFYLYLRGISLPHPLILLKMSIWIISFCIFGSIVLTFKRLIPIGEGQRYLEMASVPSVVLSAILLQYFSLIFGSYVYLIFAIIIIGNLGLIIFFQIKGIITDKNRSLTKDLTKAYKFINTLKDNPRIICIPHQITTMTVYNTNADILVNADNPGLMKIMDFYPILKKTVTQLAKKYDLNYLLLRESFVKLSELKLKKSNIVFQSGDILVVKIKIKFGA